MSVERKKEGKLQNNPRKIISSSISETEDHFDSYRAMVPSLSLTALGMMNSTPEIYHK